MCSGAGRSSPGMWSVPGCSDTHRSPQGLKCRHVPAEHRVLSPDSLPAGCWAPPDLLSTPSLAGRRAEAGGAARQSRGASRKIARRVTILSVGAKTNLGGVAVRRGVHVGVCSPSSKCLRVLCEPPETPLRLEGSQPPQRGQLRGEETAPGVASEAAGGGASTAQPRLGAWAESSSELAWFWASLPAGSLSPAWGRGAGCTPSAGFGCRGRGAVRAGGGVLRPRRCAGSAAGPGRIASCESVIKPLLPFRA